MKINYDSETDSIYISFKSGKYDHTKKVTDEILVDVDKRGKVLGLEVLDAKHNFGTINPDKVNFSTKPSSTRS